MLSGPEDLRDIVVAVTLLRIASSARFAATYRLNETSDPDIPCGPAPCRTQVD